MSEKRTLEFWGVGLFDGEGCFSCQKTEKANGKIYYSGQMIINMKSERTIKHFQEIVGDGNVYEGDDNTWRWVLSGKKCLPYLERTKELFITKQEEAEAFYEFLNLDKKDTSNKERLFRKIKYLKKEWF